MGYNNKYEGEKIYTLKEVVKLTDSNRANGNGSGEYQPSKTYEHVEGDLWVEEDEET